VCARLRLAPLNVACALQVKPVMAKLRSTLIGSGGMLLACALTLSGVISASSDEDGVYGRGAAM